MVFAVRALTVVVLTGLLGAGLAGCDGAFTEEEAQARCDQEQQARAGGCMDESAYSQCLTAYEECGEDVSILESCPTMFVCTDSSAEPADDDDDDE